jgi:hypothetical protein
MFVPCNAIISSWLTAYPNATAAQKAQFCSFVAECGAAAAGPTAGVTLGNGAPAVAPAAGTPLFYLDATSSTLYGWTGTAWVSTAPAVTPPAAVCTQVAATPDGVLVKAYGLKADGTCALEQVVQGASTNEVFDAIPAGSLATIIGQDASGNPVQQAIATPLEVSNLGGGPMTAFALGQAINDGVGVDCANNVLQDAIMGLVNTRYRRNFINRVSFPAVAANVPAGTHAVGAEIVLAASSGITITNPSTSCQAIMAEVDSALTIYNLRPAGGDPTQGIPYIGFAHILVDGARVTAVGARTNHVSNAESTQAYSMNNTYMIEVQPGQSRVISMELTYVNPHSAPQVVDAGQVQMTLESNQNVVLTYWS